MSRLGAVALTVFLWLPPAAWAEFSFIDLWLTPNQQGQRLADRGNYSEAAARYVEPMRRGVALFRSGDFEAAAAAFGRVEGADAAYNQGNSLTMLGQYEAAIESYDRALMLRPDWIAAVDNRSIAEIRLQRMAPPEDDAGGTGGQMGADDWVFDQRGARGSGEETVEPESAGSDQALRAMWLRRVQTRPADFLRSRFAYQIQRDKDEPGP